MQQAQIVIIYRLSSFYDENVVLFWSLVVAFIVLLGLVIFLTINVLSRRRVEQALRESERKFRDMAKNIPGLVFQFHVDCNGSYYLSYTSPHTDELFGFPDECNNPIETLEKRLVPEERESFIASVNQAITNRADWHYEGQILMSDGPTKWFQAIASATEVGDDLVFDGILFDITERKRAEAVLAQERTFLRAILDSLPDAIYLKDTAMRKTLANRADLTNIGKSEDEILGKTDWDLFPADIAARFNADDQAVFQSGQAVLDHEELLVNSDGQSRWLLTSKLPLRDNEGHIIGLVGIGRDITERKQMEESLRESNRRLKGTLTELKETQDKIVQQERLAAVGQLAAGIAHDFNNILTSILGFAELLRLSPDTPETQRADLGRIVASAQRAAHLVRQILDFTHKSIHQPQLFDLVLSVEDIVKFLERTRTIPENIQLNLEIEPGVYLIEADPTQIQQMLTNLVINARDAMPSGGILKIGLSRLSLPGEASCVACSQPITGEWISLTVTDTGSGIPPEVLLHIFEPFFTTKSVGSGVGLGLSQVLGIVEQHGGHLSIESQVGQGTTFTVYLPPLNRLL